MLSLFVFGEVLVLTMILGVAEFFCKQFSLPLCPITEKFIRDDSLSLWGAVVERSLSKCRCLSSFGCTCGLFGVSLAFSVIFRIFVPFSYALCIS